MGKTKIGAAAIVCLAIVGCGGTLDDVRSAHDGGRGMTRVYAGTPDRAYAAALEVMRLEEATTDLQEHPAEHYVMGTREAGLFRYGAFVGVWIREAGADRVQIDVVTRRTSGTWAIGVTEGTFHAELAKRLAASAAPAVATK